MYQKLSKILWVCFIGGLVFFTLYITSIYYNWGNLYGGMPDLQELENPKNEIASELYSADGVLLGKYYRENRSPVAHKDLSPNLLNALKATEDIRFEQHSGIDFKGTLAVVGSILKLDPRGASTISQQLAKNLFKTRENLMGKLSGILGKVSNKFKEWILAIRIERAYTKDEIITMYLNTVDFGSNAFGIKAASKTFFDKTPDQLSVNESAILVGLLKAPTYYNPKLNPENSKHRKTVVLNQMRKYEFISQAEYDSLKEVGLGMENYHVENHNKGLATYFRTEVAKYLNNWCKERGMDLYADGLKIHTTIDSRLQQYAEYAVDSNMRVQQAKFFKQWKGKNPWRDEKGRELKDFLKKVIKRTEHYRVLKDKYKNNEAAIFKALNKKRKMRVFTWNGDVDTTFSAMDSLKYYKHFLHAGMMSIDPYTGHIKAWVGGINHQYFKYDHVKKTSRRQPGSTFKPFVYALAIEKVGKHPCVIEQDVPITFSNPGDPTKPWTPKNSDGYSNQFFTIRQAMARSINSIAAKMISDLSGGETDGLVGAKKVADFLNNKLGVEAELAPVPSICLGSSDVSVYEMVGAYGAFVNHGVWIEPTYITKIFDKNGKLIHEFVPKKIEAMSAETAYNMVHMLRGGMQESGGTSLGLNRYKFVRHQKDGVRLEVGGKTGTTSNNSDAWYMGITPHLVTGVWSGGDDRSIHFRYTRDGQGARQAMPAYALYMDKVYADKNLKYRKEKTTFIKPKAITKGYFDCSNFRSNTTIDTDSLNITMPGDPEDIM
ncbi:MAG: transglycosylase domain-containing protein [Flammeovirgaceae bacterium]